MNENTDGADPLIRVPSRLSNITAASSSICETAAGEPDPSEKVRTRLGGGVSLLLTTPEKGGGPKPFLGLSAFKKLSTASPGVPCPGLILWLALFCCTAFAYPQGVTAEQSPLAQSELEKLVGLALRRNPRVLAARELLRRTLAERDEVAAFLDPHLVGAAGRSERTRAVPGATVGSSLDPDSIMASVGIEMPFRPGAYLAFGLAERYLLEPGDDYDSLYQSLVGVQMRIPLARDRLFARWHAEEKRALAGIESTSDGLTTVIQEVRHEVELAYVEYIYSLADIEVAQMAVARAEKLLAEAEELVRLKVIPEYQLSPARMEVALGHETHSASLQTCEERRILLSELIGESDLLTVGGTAEMLVPWAEDGPAPEHVSPEEACERRGLYGEILGRVRAAEAENQLEREDLKPDIALALSVSWEAEDPDRFIGQEPLLDEEGFGSEIAIVWKQPLGFRAEKARLVMGETRIAALREQLRQARLRIVSELAIARTAFESAQVRLRLVTAAVEEATRNLSAENERFRLGQGRSRDVLDGQKDLTAAVRRRNNAAAALLRARAHWVYATGYPGGNERELEKNQKEEEPSYGVQVEGSHKTDQECAPVRRPE